MKKHFVAVLFTTASLPLFAQSNALPSASDCPKNPRACEHIALNTQDTAKTESFAQQGKKYVDMQTQITWSSLPYATNVDFAYTNAGNMTANGVVGSAKLLPTNLLGVTCGTKQGGGKGIYNPMTGQITVSISSVFMPAQTEHVYCRIPCQQKLINLVATSQTSASNELVPYSTIQNMDTKTSAMKDCNCGAGMPPMPVPAKKCPAD